jgi:hypothetical protein
MQEQERQQGSLLAATQGELVSIPAHLERAENAKVHRRLFVRRHRGSRTH